MTATGSAAMLDHLAAMTDHKGLFEHAEMSTPRVEHGYCTDDNARMLVVTSREADAAQAGRLSRTALSFVLSAQSSDGRVRNRMDASGRWQDRLSTDDCWGRSLWAFGVAATSHDNRDVRSSALASFDKSVRQRSRWSRAMAFAALGAADIAAAHPGHVGARALLRSAVGIIGRPASGPWAWPEPALRYANATLAEATIAAGSALGDAEVLERGLAMLGWLLDRETSDGHLSVTGAAGRRPWENGPQFDQQPIEVAAMADACWRAHQLTGDRRWALGVRLAAIWFEGANDAGVPMRDIVTGGAFDGLRADGVNLNQGAESTLALVSTTQRAAALRAVVS